MGTTFTGLSGKKASDFGHGKASLITYMNVFSNPIANPNMIENVEVDSRQREVEVGDVFFTTSSETPEEVGMSSVLKKKIGITYLNSFCFGFRPSVKFDLDYLAFMLRSESVRKQIKLLAQGISRFNIAKTKMMYIDIQVPKIDEQIAIGKYFAQLDRLITLHQCNCNMATRPCEWSSGLRAIAWEQRKVSDMFKVTRGYVLAAALTDDTKSDEIPYPVYSSQTKDSGLMGYYRDYLYEDAITWTTDGANAGTVNYRAGKFYCTNVCGVLLSDRINASQMVAEALNNVAKGYVSYVGNPKLMNNIMADIEIMIPVSSMEQKMISDYFATLDRLVALHQRKHILLT